MALSKEDFDCIRNLIKEHSGIWLSDMKMTFLETRLSSRLKETNMDTVKDYFYYLKYDPQRENELERLIDAVAIKETYFFRDEEQLEDFSQQIVPELLKKKAAGQPLMVWSAACATGEEPYTLAMLLLEHPAKIHPSRINILASDISPTALQAAREGIYDTYSLRHAAGYHREKYFEGNSNGKYQVKDQVKHLVRFANINIINSLNTGRIQHIDCIFCSNVLIYFDDQDKGNCLNNFYQALKKGGYLLTSQVESLSRLSHLFEMVRLKKTTAYRKPE